MSTCPIEIAHCVSVWFQSFGYNGPQLDDTYWRSQPNGECVIQNYKEGEHDYASVIQLINQSNPDRLIAVLRYVDLPLKNS